MDRIKEKIATYKAEAESWQDKYDELNNKLKELEQDNTEKENSIKSLNAKNQQLDTQVEKLEGELVELKQSLKDSTTLQAHNESFNRKNEELETNLDETDTKLKETQEILRETDLNAEKLQRKVMALEQEHDLTEQKNEELTIKYNAAKKELDEIAASLENL